MVLLPDVAISVLVFFSQLSWACTGFGSAIILQCGYYALSLLSLTDGSLSSALALISISSSVVLPIQALLLRKQPVQWPLVFTLVVPQYLAVWAGIELLVRTDTPWLKRAVGLFFFLIAVHRIRIEYIESTSSSHGNGKGTVSEEQSTDDGGRLNLRDTKTFAAVILTGTSSGFLRGLCGAGGPPLMLFVSAYGLKQDRVRTLNCFTMLLFEPCRAVLILVVQQRWESSRWQLYLVFACCALAGVVVGNELVAPRMYGRVFLRSLLALMSAGSLLMMTADTPASEISAVTALAALIVLAFVAIVRSCGGSSSDSSGSAVEGMCDIEAA